MNQHFDTFTGKQLDGPHLMGTSTGEFCEVCGAEIIARCPRCGAPNCCPGCCANSALEEL